MNAPPDIRAVLLAEYIRLSKRDGELQVLIENAKRELAVLRDRCAGLSPALKAYGLDKDASVGSYIADTYIKGWPTHFIADVVSDISEAETKITEEDVERKASELGIKRPAGWTKQQADADFSREDSEADDWLERICGLPPFTDTPTPEPLKALPAPASILVHTEPAPSTSVHTGGEDAPLAPVSEAHDDPVVATNEIDPVECGPPVATEPAEDRVDVYISPFYADRWTPERVAIASRDYPTYRPKEEILDELNALPGERITGTQFSNFMFSVLNLRRPADFLQRQKSADMATWQTPERLALLRKRISEGAMPHQYCPDLAELPGPPLPNNKAVQNYARSKGWTATALENAVCVQCGGPRSPSSGERCRKCFDANVAEKRAAQAAEEAGVTQTPPPKISRVEALVRIGQMVTPITTPRPPDPPQPSLPIDVRTRDGAMSVVAKQLRDDAQTQESVPATRDDIVAWAKDNKAGISGGKVSVSAVNEVRRNFGLPPFRLIGGV